MVLVKSSKAELSTVSRRLAWFLVETSIRVGFPVCPRFFRAPWSHTDQIDKELAGPAPTDPARPSQADRNEISPPIRPDYFEIRASTVSFSTG